MTVRITGGRLARRVLKVPREGVRPTSDRARESLFSSISARLGAGGDVLDLFAGTGVMAFEAMSRGMDRAVLVERDNTVRTHVVANVAALGLSAQIEVRAGDAFVEVKRLKADAFSLVFLDPPYALALTDAFLHDVIRITKPGGVVFLERSSKDVTRLAMFSSPVFDRRYGDIWIRGFEKPSTSTGTDEISAP